MTTTVTLWAATVESLEVSISTDVDPTATPPQFALSAAGSTSPGSFSPGTWAGTWNASTEQTTARTPSIGSGGTLTIASGSSYLLWTKVTLGGEVAVWPVGSIRVP
jgi:hypothetical protein